MEGSYFLYIMKKPDILIISPQDDGHTAVVKKHIEHMAPDLNTFVLNSQDFPQKIQINSHFNNNNHYKTIVDEEQNEISLNNIRSVWFRRPKPPSIDPEIKDNDAVEFAQVESEHCLYGLWHSTIPALWVNPISEMKQANHKIYQLQLAQNLGIKVPDTLITNSPQQAKEFYNKYPKIIFKSLSSKQKTSFATKVLTEKELPVLDSVSFSPVIFQQFIPALYDLRVTIIDNRIFSAKIYSQQSERKLDWRSDWGIKIEPYQLPTQIEKKLLHLMKKLRLVYGAIDLRVTPNNDYIFFEINVGGQFLFIEIETELPISQTLAELLIRGQ